MVVAFKYVSIYGISTASSYPYTASGGIEGQCSVGKDSGIKVTGYMEVPSTEITLKQAVGELRTFLASLLSKLNTKHYLSDCLADEVRTPCYLMQAIPSCQSFDKIGTLNNYFKILLLSSIPVDHDKTKLVFDPIFCVFL